MTIIGTDARHFSPIRRVIAHRHEDKDLGCSFKRKFTSLPANNRIHASDMSVREATTVRRRLWPQLSSDLWSTQFGQGYILQLNLKQDSFWFLILPTVTPRIQLDRCQKHWPGNTRSPLFFHHCFIACEISGRVNVFLVLVDIYLDKVMAFVTTLESARTLILMTRDIKIIRNRFKFHVKWHKFTLYKLETRAGIANGTSMYLHMHVYIPNDGHTDTGYINHHQSV